MTFPEHGGTSRVFEAHRAVCFSSVVIFVECLCTWHCTLGSAGGDTRMNKEDTFISRESTALIFYLEFLKPSN